MQVKIVFMGTPDFAVPSLRMLIQEGYDIAAVVTQPDRPKGRKKTLTAPPIKQEAEKHGLSVLQPQRLKNSPEVDQIKAWRPDLIVTAAYGQILPSSLLDLPRLGCINVHASLLSQIPRGCAYPPGDHQWRTRNRCDHHVYGRKVGCRGYLNTGESADRR